MALFKIFKGLKENLPTTYNDGYCYVTIDDGKMYIDTTNAESGRIVLNAAHADSATVASKLDSNAGSSTLPVYFSGGVPVATGTSLAVNITKNAATATKLATARALAITDADGTNKGTGFNFDGSAGGTFKLPTTIKANITGNISGNAASADKLNNDAGDSSTPVYFSGGVPVACTSLDLNTSGNAATATKLKTARTISISDNDGTNTATGTSFNGSANITVKLPTTIKANLTGNADTATTAGKLSVNGGNAETPIYFDAGVPSSCTSVKLPKIQGTNTVIAGESTGSFIAIQPEEIMVNKVAEGATTGEQFSLTSAKLKKLNTLSTASVGSTSSPVYFNGGTVTECGDSLDVDITGNAASADKLTVNGGDSNTPVYFTAGVPTPCTSLDLNTSGNAATATKWKDARNFYIADSDGTNTGVATSVNGTANATIKLPATIKATLSGKATSAGTADKLGSNGGSATVPVYFDAGIPTPCTSLSLNTTGSAAKWTTARSFTITDGTNTSTGVNVDGSGNVSLKLPTTIKATLSGNASSATTAITASKLDTDAGGATVPVYFDAGVPTPCTSLSLDTTGNAATATNVAWSGVTSKPSYYDAKAIKSISRSGTTFTATHLDGTTSTFDQQDNNSDTKVTQTVTTTNANYPLLLAPSGQTATTTTTSYFDSGVTLNPNTNTIAANISGNAATATTAASCSGNAATATKLATAQTISLTGDVTGSASFTGNSACTITATVADNSHNHTNYLPLTGGTLTGNIIVNHESGPRYVINNGTITAWFGANVAGALYGMYDVTNSKYIISCNGTKVTSDYPIYGAVWNDYAEYRSQKEEIKPGYCVASTDNGQVYKTTEKFQACDGIVSDTFGFAIGETDNCKTPLAVAGRVLAYCEGDRYSYHSGDTVCAGPGGKVVKMTREEIREWPDRIVGIVSEIPEYETWGTDNVAVDDRIWIKVK